MTTAAGESRPGPPSLPFSAAAQLAAGLRAMKPAAWRACLPAAHKKPGHLGGRAGLAGAPPPRRVTKVESDHPAAELRWRRRGRSARRSAARRSRCRAGSTPWRTTTKSQWTLARSCAHDATPSKDADFNFATDQIPFMTPTGPVTRRFNWPTDSPAQLPRVTAQVDVRPVATIFHNELIHSSSPPPASGTTAENCPLSTG
jgi:hypothetical protein